MQLGIPGKEAGHNSKQLAADTQILVTGLVSACPGARDRSGCAACAYQALPALASRCPHNLSKP